MAHDGSSGVRTPPNTGSTMSGPAFGPLDRHGRPCLAGLRTLDRRGRPCLVRGSNPSTDVVDHVSSGVRTPRPTGPTMPRRPPDPSTDVVDMGPPGFGPLDRVIGHVSDHDHRPVPSTYPTPRTVCTSAGANPRSTFAR